MISITEAKKIIAENISPLPSVKAILQNATGMLIADVYAPIDIPAFNQSSVDGYALAFNGWQQHKTLTINGEIPAGHSAAVPFSSQNAVRIFTGAPVPDGADTVVMQEKTTLSNGLLFIEDAQLQTGANVRPKGSEIKARELALAKGTYLSPAAIGFLAGIGIAEVSVIAKPSVSIIVTGNELQQPGKPLLHGQVYESNSFTLVAALQQLNLTDVKVFWADDSLYSLKKLLENALSKSDVVLMTGGVSVGDYDFVLDATTACDVTKLFHRVKQKPGKPLYFGKKENRLVFGLPGNPSAVLTCFYEYVIPALQLLNSSIRGLQKMHVPFVKTYKKAAGLTHFLKGFYDGNAVTPLSAQESYRLSSFAKANCIIYVNEETAICNEGEVVEIHLLPF